MEKLVFSWNEWTTICVAVFLPEVYCLLSAYLWRKIRISSSSQYQFNSEFVHLLSCFWELSKRQSRLLFFEWVKANTWLSSYNFPNGLAFLVSSLSDIWDDHKEPQNVSGKTSPSFSLTSMRFCYNEDHTLMECPLNHRRCHFCSSSKFLKIFALWMRSADTSGS